MNGTTFQLGVTFVVLILPAAVTILWVRKYKATGTALTAGLGPFSEVHDRPLIQCTTVSSRASTVVE